MLITVKALSHNYIHRQWRSWRPRKIIVSSIYHVYLFYTNLDRTKLLCKNWCTKLFCGNWWRRDG